MKNYNVQLIYPSIHHRSIDGVQLCRRREAAGMTQAELGRAVGLALGREVGLSQQYIVQLERIGLWEIPTVIAGAIEKVLGG